MRGKVVYKRARYDLCFDEVAQEPDYPSGKGRIIAIEDLPVLTAVTSVLDASIPGGTKDLKVEGNMYHDVNVCGIGFHGDSERKKVAGVRAGASFPLVFQWYQASKKVGEEIRVMLNSGDIYMMSEKATGNDWKKRKILTVRHSAGCAKYTK